MAEIHLLNESGRSLEVLALETGGEPMDWRPQWDRAAQRWLEASSTSAPRHVTQHAWTRTALLGPGAHVLRLTWRFGPDDAPMTVSVAYLVLKETFCEIVVRLNSRSVSISSCEPRADMIGAHPDL